MFLWLSSRLDENAPVRNLNCVDGFQEFLHFGAFAAFLLQEGSGSLQDLLRKDVGSHLPVVQSYPDSPLFCFDRALETTVQKAAAVRN